eukprot:3602360-Rhodomonas_salina.1
MGSRVCVSAGSPQSPNGFESLCFRCHVYKYCRLCTGALSVAAKLVRARSHFAKHLFVQSAQHSLIHIKDLIVPYSLREGRLMQDELWRVCKVHRLSHEERAVKVWQAEPHLHEPVIAMKTFCAGCASPAPAACCEGLWAGND